MVSAVKRMGRVGASALGVDWAVVHQLRAEIARLEAKLAQRYERRAAILVQMCAAGMGQREAGAYWGISNPRVSQAIKKYESGKGTGGGLHESDQRRRCD
jgi:hypothetical protein